MSDGSVAEYYSHGALEEQILDALVRIGADPEHLHIDQLAPVDEFHVGGRAATMALVDQMDLHPGLRVLDVGSGLGGTARYLAHEHKVAVTGIDVTAEDVQVARSLTRRAALADRVTFLEGSAVCDRASVSKMTRGPEATRCTDAVLRLCLPAMSSPTPAGCVLAVDVISF
ncbi:MAG TPA: methyltransferase domain-containing protein, partial [Pseudonocardiaceae bacterium]